MTLSTYAATVAGSAIDLRRRRRRFSKTTLSGFTMTAAAITMVFC
jgi:hypothetical protein